MAYNFVKIGEVKSLNEVPENASVLNEVGGELYRVPIDQFGVPTANFYIENLSGLFDAANGSSGDYTITCGNMTFAEAKSFLRACRPLQVVFTACPTEQAPISSSWHAMGCCYVPEGTETEISSGDSECIIVEWSDFAIGVIVFFQWMPDGTIAFTLPSSASTSSLLSSLQGAAVASVDEKE